ncbi:MAG: SusC/RagA family TonB-linked outer membrane protein, partial [Prolixibacteraceae bacterium]
MTDLKHEKQKRLRVYFSRVGVVILGLFLMATSVVYAQNVTVKGKVTDAQTNESIPGASVVVKGTNTGVVTDMDGAFTISAPSNSTLLFSFIGYAAQEIPLNGKTQLNVKLIMDTQQIEEVVAVGYGTAKRKDLMGAVSSVSAAELIKAPVASAVEAMAGRLAGVQITATEGSPDAEINIRVRGGGSITGSNSPLFIVDGFPVNNINDIAPSDIESIDVLKDASSTAIYGSRGAYGVVIVTTKSGTKSGKLKVSYNSFYAFKKIAKTLNVLTPEDFVKYQYELSALRDNVDVRYEPYYGSYGDLDQYAGMVGNDWQDQIFGHLGTAFNNNFNLRGGTDAINYSFSYANVQDKAIMLGSDFKRDNINLKLNSKPSKKIALDFSVRYSNTEIKGGGSNSFEDKGSSGDARLKQALMYSPIPIKGMTDQFDEEENASNLINPILSVNDNDRNRVRKNWTVNGAFSWDIIENMRFKTELGLDDYQQNDNRFYGISTYYTKNNVGAFVGMPATIETNNLRNTFRNTNTLFYDFKNLLNDQHSLNLLAGEENILIQSSNTENDVWGLPTFFDSNMAFHFMSSGNASYISHYYNPDDKMLSFFGRMNYSYQGKYLLSATFR